MRTPVLEREAEVTHVVHAARVSLQRVRLLFIIPRLDYDLK